MSNISYHALILRKNRRQLATMEVSTGRGETDSSPWPRLFQSAAAEALCSLVWNLHDKVIDSTKKKKLPASLRVNSMIYGGKPSHSMNAVEHMPHLLRTKYINGTCCQRCGCVLVLAAFKHILFCRFQAARPISPVHSPNTDTTSGKRSHAFFPHLHPIRHNASGHALFALPTDNAG